MKFTNPTIHNFVNPEKMTLQQLANHQGRNYRVQSVLWRNIMNIGCFSVFCARNYYKHLIYGSDKRGGDILKMKTQLSSDEIEFNWTFLQHKYLQEPLKNKINTSELELRLESQGKKVEQHAPMKSSIKKMPHPKYL